MLKKLLNLSHFAAYCSKVDFFKHGDAAHPEPGPKMACFVAQNV